MWEVWGSLDPLPHTAPVPAAACRLPIVPGPCQSLVTRWAFDAAQGKCITFSYGGCKGNGNQFYSEKECKEYCGAPQLAGTPPVPPPQGSSLHHLLSCTGSAWGGDRAVLILDGAVLTLDGSRMGPSWAWDGFVMGSRSVWLWTGFVLCLGWVSLGQDGSRVGVSLGWDGFVVGLWRGRDGFVLCLGGICPGWGIWPLTHRQHGTVGLGGLQTC